MKILVTTTPGLEEITACEIKELVGREAKKVHLGLLRLECDEKDLYKLCIFGRSIHRLILLLLEGEFSSLKDIYTKTKEIDFTKYIYETQTFAVRAKRCGDKTKHNFTSIDLAAEVGQAVVDCFKGEGKRIRVNLDEPNVIIRAGVSNHNFWIGIDAVGEESLAKRGYRVYNHPAALKTTIAYSLVRVAGWKFEESFIDPTCGSGTIPIEAMRYACAVPNRQNLALLNLFFLKRQEFLEMWRDAQDNVRELELEVYGCDINRGYVEGARENAKRAGVSVNFFDADARDVSLDYDVIVSNPPYGIRLGNPRKVEKFYEGFAGNLRKYDRWRVFVVFTARADAFRKYMGEPKREIDVIYGNLPSKVMVYW
ncbi:MAG: tRNA (guanine(6)-N2)-methyltransferase [Candidatus Methanospirareceae archaeon]